MSEPFTIEVIGLDKLQATVDELITALAALESTWARVQTALPPDDAPTLSDQLRVSAEGLLPDETLTVILDGKYAVYIHRMTLDDPRVRPAR